VLNFKFRIISRINARRPHVAVFLYGLTAILGDLISIPAASLVWWRVVITGVSLLFLIKFGADLLKIPRSLIIKLLGVGVIVGIHWVAFYGSIKYANASIALIALSTTTLFTSFIEPLVFKRRPDPIQILFGLLIIPGIYLIVRNISVTQMTGLYIGILSAFMAALFSVFNKDLVDKVDPFPLTFLEMAGVFVFLSILYPIFSEDYFSPFMPVGMDWIYLLILCLLCTTFAYYLGLLALKKMSAFETNLIINLEPVYGIILAIIILKEHRELDFKFYVGVLIILVVVFSYPLVKKYLIR